ncbi:MAG TPA: biotin transporter BioY [Longimicrobiales bacterium]|nr:biotin transporter BioY [Longimicrobiales bacterium]
MSEALTTAGTRSAETRVARRTAAVLLFAVLTAISAAIEIPIPGSPVPVTMQSLMVSLSGVLLGPMLGAASQIVYVMAGAVGAPVFSGGDFGFAHLLGPTGGYLLAFPVAAAVTGRLAGRSPAKWNVLAATRLGIAIFLGTVVIFAGGYAQLALLTGDSVRAFQLGVLPFIVGDIVKVLAALAVAIRYRNRTLEWL